MKREFREETGGAASWLHFATLTNAEATYEVHFFSGPVTEKPETVTDEAVEWVDPDRLPDDVLPNLRFLVPLSRSPGRDWPLLVIERGARP